MIAHLMKLPAWLIWRTEPNPKGDHLKPLKVPLHWDGLTRHSSANPAPLLTYDQAVACASMTGCMLGFRPQPEHGVCCLDLDDCLDSAGNPNDFAQKWISYLPGAAIEVSWSGRGLHLWFSHKLPDPGRHGKKNGIELYGSNQFIAMGRYLGGDAAADCTPQLAQILAAYFPQETTPTVNPERVEWDVKSPAAQLEAATDIADALRWHDPDSYDEWVACGQALCGLGETGYALWATWSATSTRYPGGADLGRWDTFSGARTGYQSILKRAQARGWVNPRKGVQVKAEDVFKPVAVQELPAKASIEGEKTLAGNGMRLSEVSAGGPKLESSVSNIARVLRDYRNVIEFAHDSFKDRPMLFNGTKQWIEAGEYELLQCVEKLELSGFKPVAMATMKNAVTLLSKERKFDSAIEWANGLQWDGVPRIETAMSRYFGTVDSPYTRAVGMYLFTALAGRCLVPGIQADMAVILVGPQGGRKSSAIAALAPYHDAYVNVSLNDKDKELAMRVKGRLIAELPELAGLSRRDIEHTRDWITRRVEQWRGMRQDELTNYARRFVIIGNSNEREILDDPHGNRRWLPVDSLRADDAAVAQDRDQLWAEGVAYFRANGIQWEAAEGLARSQHGAFEVSDSWEDAIQSWLALPPQKDAEFRQPGAKSNSECGVRVLDVLKFALQFTPDRIRKSDEMRAAKILRKLSYLNRTTAINGISAKWWFKAHK
jgi:Virulence-associated protein E/Primase C terminal 2 (PriCT-2)